MPIQFSAAAGYPQPRHDSYTGTGWDRGHLAPNGANALQEYVALKAAVGRLFNEAGVSANDVINDKERPEAHRYLAAVYMAITTGTELPASG